MNGCGGNRIYFVAGLVTGPLFGAAGAWLGRRFPASVWLVVGALVAGEAPAVALLAGRQLAPPPLYFSWGVADWAPYIGEAVLGSIIVVTALWWNRSKRTVT